MNEKDYQNALAIEFRKQTILIKEQQYIPLSYYDKNIRKRYCDFIVEGKIVVEIKAGTRIKYKDFKQTEGYLKVFEKKLGLLIVFGREYVTWKRVLNIL